MPVAVAVAVPVGVGVGVALGGGISSGEGGKVPPQRLRSRKARVGVAAQTREAFEVPASPVELRRGGLPVVLMLKALDGCEDLRSVVPSGGQSRGRLSG